MAKVRAALIQAHANMPKEEAIKKHEELIAEAAAKGAQITCLQEIFFGPYFCAEQDPKWYDTAERDDGPTVRRMQALAKKHKMALVVPFYEEAQTGVYYNTAVLIENDGTVLGKYRKTHIPHVGPCFWEKFYFKPGNLGYPVWDTSVGRVGILICYDRHFPEPARAGSRVPSSSSTRRPPSNRCRGIYGSWRSRRTPWPTATGSAPSIASAW